MNAARWERIGDGILGIIGWLIILALWQWFPWNFSMVILALVLRVIVQERRGGRP